MIANPTTHQLNLAIIDFNTTPIGLNMLQLKNIERLAPDQSNRNNAIALHEILTLHQDISYVSPHIYSIKGSNKSLIMDEPQSMIEVPLNKISLLPDLIHNYCPALWGVIVAQDRYVILVDVFRLVSQQATS